MSVNYFIVTTPLQYLNVLNIETLGNKVILVLGGFINSEVFFSNIVNTKVWDEAHYFENYNDMFKYLIEIINRKDKLFIDSDYGLVTNNKLRKIKTNEIYVYEEGIGSYRSDLVSRERSWLKKNVLLFLGNKEFFGGSKYVKGIYIYDHERHIKNVPSFNKERLHFKNRFSEQLKSNISNFITDNLIEKYKTLVKNKEVVLYITNWNYNKQIEKYIENIKKEDNSKLLILKPHPHFNDFNQIKIKFDDIVSGDILVEILLTLLKEFSKDFLVLHENTSSLQYYPTINNISF